MCVQSSVYVLAISVSASELTGDFERDYAGSPSLSSTSTLYSKGSIFFGNLDDSGDELMVSFEYTETYPKSREVTISRWLPSGERLIEWRSSRSDPNQSILIGNVDEDELDEVIVFEEDFPESLGTTPFLILNWEDGQFDVTRITSIGGLAAALIDFELDGIDEIVIARRTIEGKSRYWDGSPPMELSIYSLVEPYERLQRIELDHYVSSLTVGDLTGNGYEEVITHEFSHDGSVHGRLAVYAANRDNGFQRIFAENRFLSNRLSFIEVFEYDGNKYLFVEQHWKKLKTILRWEFTRSEGLEWTAIDANHVELFKTAMRRTMVLDQDNRVIERFRSPEYRTIFQRRETNVDTGYPNSGEE